MDLKATSNSNNKNNFDAEKSSLEKLELEVKNSIFGILFVLLKEEDTSYVLTFGFAIIQFLQITLFAFHDNTSAIWGDTTVIKYVGYVVDTAEVVHYFEQTSWSIYITFMYIALGILGLILLDSLYIVYAFNKKRLSFQAPIHILRVIIMLITTILYQPVLDYFINIMFCIPDKDGILVHHQFTEIECWKSSHIIHAVFSIIGSISYIIICSVSVACFFEYKSTTNVPNARVNARANLIFLIYQTIMIILLNFLYKPVYHYVFIIFMLVGGFILFFKFHYSSPYYNDIVARLWSTVVAVNFWTAIMLTFAKFMEGTLFEGSVSSWLIGIPFIILIVISNRDTKIDYLLVNVNKIENCDKLQNQIRYMLKLANIQSVNKNAAVLLDGYLEVHKQTCNKEDCPLKQKNIKGKNANFVTKNDVNNQDALSDEKFDLLLQVINQIFALGLKKYPTNTSLRILYSFFFMEKMNMKQQAIQELNTAEQNKPPFDEQFIIYRYRRIIEDEIAESRNEGNGVDVVSEIASQNHMRLMQANIEKSSILHMEFWSQLSEDTPDLAKLNDIGSKINSSLEYVEEHWNKLRKINENLPKASKLYGRFLTEIINDKDNGDRWIEKARTQFNNNAHKKGHSLTANVVEDNIDNAIPTIFVSGDPERLGLITGINLVAASLFGYNKTELLNRNIKILMPQLFMKNHDTFLERYAQTQEGQMINKERYVYGKNKSNYIFPFHILIRGIQNNYQTMQFVATFRIEKNFKNNAHMIFLSDGTIDGISSSCVSILKLDLKTVIQKKSSIFEYFPNILKDKNIYLSKSGGIIVYNFQKDDINENDEHSIQLMCTMQEINFHHIDGSVVGYSIKLEKLQEKFMSSSNSQAHGHRKTKPNNFQFRYERMKGIIVGEYTDSNVDDLQSEMPEGSQLLSQVVASIAENEEGTTNIHSTTHNFINSNVNNEAQNNQKSAHGNKIDYGFGIKTLRIRDGDPREINDDRSDSEEENEDQEDSNKKQEMFNDKNDDHGIEAGSLKEFKVTFKSKKILNNVIQDRTPPKSVRRLKWIANILFLYLIAMAIADYFTALQKYKDIELNAHYINLSNQRMSEINNVVSKVEDLVLISLGLFEDTDASYEKNIKLEIQSSLDEVKSIQQILQLGSMDISLPQNLTDLMTKNTIEMFFISGDITTSKLFDLNDAVDQIVGRALSLSHYDIDNITEKNADVFFAEYNIFNSLYMGLKSAIEYFVIELGLKCTYQHKIFLTFLLVTLGVLFLVLIILVPVLKHVNNAREEVLSLFLDIPERTVKNLYQKCENFISSLQVGDDDDIISDGDEDLGEKTLNDDDMPEIKFKRKRKKFKNSGRNQTKFFLKFLLGTGLLSIYFFVTYFLSKTLLSDMSQMILEYNSTSMAEMFYYRANCGQKYMFINSSRPIRFQPALTINQQNIDTLYRLDSLVQEEHSINVGLHPTSYNDAFNQIILKEPCSLITDVVSLENCTGFADGLVAQGLELGITRHFENIRYLLSKYVYFTENPSAAFEEVVDLNSSNITFTRRVVYDDSTEEGFQQNNILNLLLLPQALELDTMQTVYIKNLMRLLVKKFEEGISEKIDGVMSKRLGVFLAFILALGALYLLFWIPTINKLNKDIWRTRSMLTMIPMNVVAKIVSIRNYIKRFLKEKHLTNE